MNVNAKLRRATLEELRVFYDWMKKQFHPGELKQLEHISRMCTQGRYCAYGLWDGDMLLAYALLANADKVFLLDYYAVLPQYQDSGWGSRFLGMLRDELPGDAIIFEVEDPAYAPDEEARGHWQRRIRFYEKNGCVHTPVKLNLFGFDYTIMQLPVGKKLHPAQVRAALESIYHFFCPPELFAENVHFRDIEPAVRSWETGRRRIARYCADPAAPVLYVHCGEEEARQLAQSGWTVVAVGGIDWNHDLTPWPAKAVFRGQPDFTGGAEEYLKELKENIIPAAEADIAPSARAILGYSLAGLFAAYAAMETGLFDMAASVSGSMWYPGFAEYAQNAPHCAKRMYFSVGDREKLSRSAAFRSVEECTFRVMEAMEKSGAETFFERNPGGHFDDPAGRMMRALDWIGKGT